LTPAAQFQADMVESHRGKTQTNKIYLLDDQFRLDAAEEGRMLDILGRGKKILAAVPITIK